MIGTLVSVVAEVTTRAIDTAWLVVCAPIEHGPGARLADAGWDALASKLVK